MSHPDLTGLAVDVLDVLPDPVLVKDDDARYVWVNRAFEELFDVRRDDLVGRLDVDVFPHPPATQCSGGDQRVLEDGETDEVHGTVTNAHTGPREIITRKNRLTAPDGRRFLVGVVHDVTEVVGTNRRLEESARLLERQSLMLRHMANTDPLTGCLNRRALFEIAGAAYAPDDGSGGLLVLDLDHFKAINDCSGHGAGDAALVYFSDVVRSVIRSTDLFARLGGEEFAVLLPGASAVDTRRVAERIVTEVADSLFAFHGEPISMTVSIGGVHHDSGAGFDLEAWLVEADARLYEAKDAGRNRAVLAA